jgi:hypothetical protein
VKIAKSRINKRIELLLTNKANRYNAEKYTTSATEFGGGTCRQSRKA